MCTNGGVKNAKNVTINCEFRKMPGRKKIIFEPAVTLSLWLSVFEIENRFLRSLQATLFSKFLRTIEDFTAICTRGPGAKPRPPEARSGKYLPKGHPLG